MFFLIKLGKVYINITAFFLLVFYSFFADTKMLIMTYFIILIHELSHLFVALILKMEISYIAILPFGMNLQLKPSYKTRTLSTVFLYLAGIISNALMIVVAHFFKFKYIDNQIFIMQNIIILFINILPIFPLDGGVILKTLLYYFYGLNFAEKTTKIISNLILFVLIIASLYVIFITKFNFSLVVFISFLVSNFITTKTKRSNIIVKELMNFKGKMANRPVMSVQNVAVNETYSAKDIIGHFALRSMGIVYIISTDGKLIGSMSEIDFFERVIKKGATSLVKDLLELV